MKLSTDAMLCARCGVHLRPGLGRAHADTRMVATGEGLTPSERRVYLLLCNGLSNRQIARLLEISENTVRFHLKQLYGKLGVRSRSHAVALSGAEAHEAGRSA